MHYPKPHHKQPTPISISYQVGSGWQTKPLSIHHPGMRMSPDMADHWIIILLCFTSGSISVTNPIVNTGQIQWEKAQLLDFIDSCNFIFNENNKKYR